MEAAERKAQIAFATRQFECLKMRALLAYAQGDVVVMQNFIDFMSDTNDLLDRLYREELESVEGGK